MMAQSGEHVLLLSLPFGALERPSLALGLLQAHCARLGTPCDTRYLTFRFAEAVGLANYQWVAADLPYTAFVGEWLFAEALYGGCPEAGAGYLDEILRDSWRLAEADVARLLRMREQVEPFLEACLGSVLHDDHTLVGFTSVFHQNLPSLALAARLKRARPDLTIAFGGANWEEEMGLALLEQFPFVDLAFSGEADRSFPSLLKTRAEGRPVDGIPGVTAQGGRPGAEAARATAITDLDETPVPDFDPWFEQLQASSAATSVVPTLPVETARGCWWGARSHCTFCGLNGSTMTYRSKSPRRVLNELAGLRQRYGVRSFGVVDNILDSRYFRSVLPLLAQENLDIELFWEVKANLSRSQVQTLRDAGAVCVQPGIESLSDHVLALMRKGTTALRNIEVLKWCKEYGVRPLWNLLYGFPGETAEDYETTVGLIRAIWHLDPPFGHGSVRLDRFSPYHAHPGAYGMVNVRPMAPFRHLYPFASETLDRIAYYFDYDYADGRRDDSYAREAIALGVAWKQDPDRGMLTLGQAPDGALHIVDTRYGAASPRWTVLTGWEAAVYLTCDRSQLFATLAALPEVRSADVPEDQLQGFLDRCLGDQLMVHSGGRWLGVSVHVPPREEDNPGWAGHGPASAPSLGLEG